MRCSRVRLRMLNIVKDSAGSVVFHEQATSGFVTMPRTGVTLLEQYKTAATPMKIHLRHRPQVRVRLSKKVIAQEGFCKHDADA